MYHTTGLFRELIVDLCAAIHNEKVDKKKVWPPILGLFNSVVVTRICAETTSRRNWGMPTVSQPTISRAITTVTPLLERCSASTFRLLTSLTSGLGTSWMAPCFRASVS
jgi:hypothetical protein